MKSKKTFYLARTQPNRNIIRQNHSVVQPPSGRLVVINKTTRLIMFSNNGSVYGNCNNYIRTSCHRCSVFRSWPLSSDRVLAATRWLTVAIDHHWMSLASHALSHSILHSATFMDERKTISGCLNWPISYLTFKLSYELHKTMRSVK